MTQATDVLYLHPVTSSIPTASDHKEACHEFLLSLVRHGLLSMDVRWSVVRDQWVIIFAAKGLTPV